MLKAVAFILLAGLPCITWASASGVQVADALNRRYQDTRSHCEAGLAGYHCNGVVLRGMEHPVDLYQISRDELERNAVAFSYVRADVGTTTLYNNGGFGGFIVGTFKDAALTESAAMASPSASLQVYPLTMRCAFSYDGATSTRPDGCGPSTAEGSNPPGSSRPCAAQGIVTPAQWGRHFASLGEGAGKNRSCSFEVNAKDFQLSIDARRHFPLDGRELYQERWNEVVMAAWPDEVVVQLPIEAFFFVAEVSGKFARDAQERFFTESGRVVPIVRMDLHAVQPFSFHSGDQAVAE